MLNLIFRSSWKVKAFYAVVCLSLSVALYLVSLEIEADKARALEAGVPAAVSLNEFDPKRDIHAADEVHVIGWVNPDFNYRLTETRKRKRSSYDVTRRMLVLLGPGDTVESRTVRAAVLLDEASVDRFLEDMVANLDSATDSRLLFRLSGTADSSPELESMADDALVKLGVKKAPGFQYIAPWSKAGRAADLAPDPETGSIISLAIAGVGGVFLLLAISGFRRRKNTPVVAKASGKVAMASSPALASLPAATVLGGLSVPGAPAADKAPAPVTAKGQTPRWLLPLFVVVGVLALGRVYGGGVAMGLIMLGVFVFGLIQMKRAANRGLASLFARGAAKAEPQAVAAAQTNAAAKGPIERVPGPLERLTSGLKAGSAGDTSSGIRKFIPLLIGIALMFGGNLVFKHLDLGSMSGVVSIGGPGPAQMAQSPAIRPADEADPQAGGMATAPVLAPSRAADPTVAPDAAPIAAVEAAPAPVAVQVPVVPEAAPVVAAAPAPVTPVSVTPAPATLAKAPAAEPPAKGAAGWPAFAGVSLPLLVAGGVLVLLIGGLVLIAPRLRGRLPSRMATQAPDAWARLDKMVARERALSASRQLAT